MFGRQQAPSAEHWFGTTVGGTDVLSRVIYGARTAVVVILLAVILSGIIGVPLGLVSGYLGGWVDRVLVLVMDALYSFPSLLLAIVVAIVLSGGTSGAFSGIMAAAISITVVFIPQYFRLIRNATIAVKVEPYVDAARVVGARTPRILTKHIFSNVTSSLPVIATLNASEAILTLAGLGLPRLRHRAVGRGGVGLRPQQGAARRLVRHLVDRRVPRHRHRADRARLHLDRREPQRHPQPAAAHPRRGHHGGREGDRDRVRRARRGAGRGIGRSGRGGRRNPAPNAGSRR